MPLESQSKATQKPSGQDEEVLVVPRCCLEPYLIQGFGLVDGELSSRGLRGTSIRQNTIQLIDLIERNHHYCKRSNVETDEDQKQIIPYILTRCQGMYLLLQRSQKSTEKYLQLKYTLGVGGHMNRPPPDVSDGHVLIWNLRRELFEELQFGKTPSTPKLIGIVNNENNQVGKVHFGLVYLVETDELDVSRNDESHSTCYWVDKLTIASMYPNLEAWSQFIYDGYINE